VEPEALFKEDEISLVFELTYDADSSLMPAKQVAEAITGMSTCMAIAGRTVGLDFETIHVFAPEHGSVKFKFAFTKREQRVIYIAVAGSVLAQLLGNAFTGAFSLIGEYGLPTLKQPSADILEQATKEVVQMCTNVDFRRSVPKIARPLSEVNQQVTIHTTNSSYTINMNNQYKFTTEDEQPILPELRNGETVTITGTITRINLEHNDIGISYGNRKISITPVDEETAVGKEFHQFLETPIVTVTGLVVRDSEFVVPKIRVFKIVQYKPAQTSFLDDEASSAATEK